MKTIGLLGGMSWESTLTYYKLLNEGVKKRLGGLHSAKIALKSVDFFEIEKLQAKGDWNQASEILTKEAKEIQNAGADLLLICTNTMHKIANEVQDNLDIPIIHIAKVTADVLKAENCKKTILLGTRFTMVEHFYADILERNDINVVIPNSEDIKEIDRIIFEELVVGKILEKSKKSYIRIINNLYEQNKDIDSIILGCTEIGLLITQSDTKLKVFDTTFLHVNSALDIALNQ